MTSDVRRPTQIWARPDYNECWSERLEEEDVPYVRRDIYDAVVKERDEAYENINLKADFIELTLNDMAVLDAENYKPRLRPIETAPMDGTRFLGWHPDSERYEREQIKETWMGKAPKGSPNYQKWLDGEIALNTGWEYFENDCVYKWHPTHWMPLPDPLKQTEV